MRHAACHTPIDSRQCAYVHINIVQFGLVEMTAARQREKRRRRKHVVRATIKLLPFHLKYDS